MEEKISISNNIDELPVLAEKVELTGELWNWPLPFTMNINLVLEEAVSNVIFYAFPEKGIHTIDISFKMEGDELILVIEDEGIPFDPTKKEVPDITLTAEERPIGGLGIFLIQKMMDQVIYKRENNRNILTLIKKINHEFN